MNLKNLEKYKKILLENLDGKLDGNESLDDLTLYFIMDIHLIGTDELLNELMPYLKFYIKENIKKIKEKNIDLYFTTVHPELFSYTLTFIDEIDVIELMLEYADGEENILEIVDLLKLCKIKLPEKIINRHFGDISL